MGHRWGFDLDICLLAPPLGTPPVPISPSMPHYAWTHIIPWGEGLLPQLSRLNTVICISYTPQMNIERWTFTLLVACTTCKRQMPPPSSSCICSIREHFDISWSQEVVSNFSGYSAYLFRIRTCDKWHSRPCADHHMHILRVQMKAEVRTCKTENVNSP